jgi:hypothetical protein
VNLDKLKARYLQDKKERVAAREKRKNLSEEDVWDHIKSKNLDIFSPEIDRKKILKILDLPKKNPARKELIQELGKKFSEIYYSYRHKLEEASGVTNNFKASFGQNEKHARMAAEACIVLGVTPQFVIRHYHENRDRFSNKLKYIPLSMLSNSAMIDSAVSAYFGSKDTVEFGSSFESEDQLHPLLRKKLEEAGFATQEFSDEYLLTVQGAAETIADGFPLFVPSRMKGMVHWAAKHVFGGK